MKNIAILMGGFTEEAAVSLKSGANIFKNVDTERYIPYRVIVDATKWVVLHEGQEIPINKGNFSFNINQERICFDAVFNIIHGTPGEDGMMQAYFDMIDVCHTSCPFYQAALTFNKKDTLAVLQRYGIQVAPSVFLRVDIPYSVQDIVDSVGMPCFVKPNKGGSSLGASKVVETAQLKNAIKKAFEQDDEILIEAFLDGTEVSVGVISYQGTPSVVGITEIVSENDFFDYEAKYLGKSQEITPARISASMVKQIETESLKIYTLLNLSGLSRSEFIIVDDKPFFLEINTNPGFSDASILPQQLQLKGITLKDLITDMIETAIAR